MLAVLRYKRVAYRLLSPAQAKANGLPQPPVALLPTFYFPDADGGYQPAVDSTPLIRRLDRDYAARPVVEAAPLVAIIDALIEDYADEWMTKMMFHYRWHFAADAEKAAQILVRHGNTVGADEEFARLAKMFGDRQIGRLSYVGSNEITAPVIEASFVRFLDIFENMLAQSRFVFGDKPCAADFALYGQLTQLAHFDPTPLALTLARAKRIFAWVDDMEDLSGLDDAAPIVAVPASVGPLLAEIGRVYAPVMLGNEKALVAGQTTFSCEVDGRAWTQNCFPYHRKCLAVLRGLFAGLGNSDRGACLELARVAGLEEVLAAGGD